MLIFVLNFFIGLQFSPVAQARISQWQETCPSGYVLVPKNDSYVPYNFCVMQYEARARTTSGTVDLDGCNEAGCTTSSWGTAAHSPTSVATGLPWRMIGHGTALAECKSLGPRYDLVSNAQWQTIARNLELVPRNWTSGTVGVGCMFNGNNNDTTCGYNGANPEGGTGRNSRARLFLSNGQEIWDLAGNLTEWVSDPNTFSYGPEIFMSGVSLATHATTGILNDQVARAAKEQFGPAGTYTGCNNGTDDRCGFGYGWLSPANGAISRGGNYNDTFYAGVFMNYLLNGTGGGGSVNSGFRCSYIPNDPCIYQGVLLPGTQCSNGEIFVSQFRGYDYFTTPSGCTNSANPTCAGGTDTTFKEWMGTSGSNVDIASVPNITTGAVTVPSSWSQSGQDITPNIVAAPSVSSDSYAHFCDNMNFAGKSDWFQPNKSEHALMYCKAATGSHNPIYPQEAPDCYTLGGKVSSLTGFATADGYPAAEEAAFDANWEQSFSSGFQTTDQKTNGGYARCMRRSASKDVCSGTPAIGTSCRGGAIYAGQFDSAKYMVTPAGCTDSPTPTCAGTIDVVQKIWRGSAGSDANIAGITNVTSVSSPSLQRGHVTTPLITADASVSSDSAADYCESLNYGGYTDWYLPSKSEMSYIYCKKDAPSHDTSFPRDDPNCLHYGLKSSELTGFVDGSYSTSTEFSTTNYHDIQFLNGDSGSVPKNNTKYIRCVRRYDEVPDPAIVQVANHGGVGSGTTTRSLAVSATGAGNLIAVGVMIPGSSNRTVTSVTDNVGNTYVDASARCLHNVSGNGTVDIYYAKNSIPGATSITATISGTALIQMFVAEVSNIDTVSPLEGAAGNTNPGASATPTAPKIVSSRLNNFVYSLTQTNNTISGTRPPFVTQAIAFGNAASYLLAPSGGTLGASWTQPSDVYCASTASFKSKD